MVVVTVVPVIVVVVVVVVEVLVIDVSVDVKFIEAGVIVTFFEFTLSLSYSVDMFIDVLAGAMLGVLSVISIEVLDSNAFTVVTTDLEFCVSTTVKEFSRWAAFDLWSLAALDCAPVLQAWMPSCQV